MNAPLAGLKTARVRGRKGGRKFALSKAQVRPAEARDWCTATPRCPCSSSELGIRTVTLYRYVGPQGELRERGEKVLTSLNRESPSDLASGRSKCSTLP